MIFKIIFEKLKPKRSSRNVGFPYHFVLKCSLFWLRGPHFRKWRSQRSSIAVLFDAGEMEAEGGSTLHRRNLTTPTPMRKNHVLLTKWCVTMLEKQSFWRRENCSTWTFFRLPIKIFSFEKIIVRGQVQDLSPTNGMSLSVIVFVESHRPCFCDLIVYDVVRRRPTS